MSLSFKGKNQLETDKLNLFALASHGDFTAVKFMLTKKKELAKLVDPFDNQSTLLEHALRAKNNTGSLELILPYLERNQTIREGAMIQLIERGHLRTLKMLLENKIIDPNHIYFSGRTLLDLLELKIKKNVIHSNKRFLCKTFNLLTAQEIQEVQEKSMMDELGKRLANLSIYSTDTKNRLPVFKNIYDPLAQSESTLSKSSDMLLHFSKCSKRPLAKSLTIDKRDEGRRRLELARSH